MITLDNLSYSYPNGTIALQNVRAEIPAGIHLLLGENGAGKTTLLHTIAGLRMATPMQSCHIDGVPTAKREPSVLSRTFILTDDIVFPYRTIEMMVKSHAMFYPSFDAEMLKANLECFGMTGREPIDSFSLGNRKKAQLAYALSLNVDILLLDEPANGLDITSRHILLQMMARCVSEEQTVIISTHTVWDFQNLFSNLMVLNKGQLITSQPLWDIASRISFVSDTVPVVGAIYMEQSFGRFNAIIPNDGTKQTDIDFVMLYNALQSPMSQELLTIINE